jgi:hypothetical protein
MMVRWLRLRQGGPPAIAQGAEEHSDSEARRRAWRNDCVSSFR